jgi:hypothetical protein
MDVCERWQARFATLMYLLTQPDVRGLQVEWGEGYTQDLHSNTVQGSR